MAVKLRILLGNSRRRGRSRRRMVVNQTRARLYIIRRCVFMLLCWKRDHGEWELESSLETSRGLEDETNQTRGLCGSSGEETTVEKTEGLGSEKMFLVPSSSKSVRPRLMQNSSMHGRGDAGADQFAILSSSSLEVRLQLSISGRREAAGLGVTDETQSEKR
ncbi:hypothetical protein Ancab_036766 [Ancistrocladus abbreviatus]